MKSTNTFGVNFILRQNKEINGKSPVYARISVDKKCCEIALKCKVFTNDWNAGKGAAKPKNDELRELNTYLEKVRSKIVEHYRLLEFKDEFLTAEAVKNAYLGIVPVKESITLCVAFDEHNRMMNKILKHGTLKNYYTTEGYLKAYCEKRYSGKDVYLKHLQPEFITLFEHFIRNNAIKKGAPCTQNGVMKHMERIKKVVSWAVSLGWLEKSPFTNYKLKFRRKERGFLTEVELENLETHPFNDLHLKFVRDLFVFSCYTGLAYCDLISLTHQEIGRDISERYWIYTNRVKTEIRVTFHYSR